MNLLSIHEGMEGFSGPVKVVDTRVVVSKSNLLKEAWTLDRQGTLVEYLIVFQPSTVGGRTGTQIHVESHEVVGERETASSETDA